MTKTDIESTAFHEAALRSERLRIIALVVSTGVLLLIAVLRALLSRDPTTLRPLLGVMLVVGALAVYELGMLWWIARCIRTHRQPAGYVWTANVVIESGMPTLVLFVLTESVFMGPYRALSAPAVLVYVFFILFSILRLRARLCILTGLVSALGYLAVLAYTSVAYPEPPPGAFTMGTYATYAAFMLVAGFAAAFVSTEIRKHVVAALREADTRREIERIEHDLDIARSIQQGLLPQSKPNIEGFDIAGWSQPADQTGGDYYDWQELPDGRLAISLADVTGHGIGPALVTAVCRAYARASFPTGESLGPLLDRINELLVEDLRQGRFVTFVVALVDPASAALHTLSAGHGPILVYSRREDRVEALDADDLPFGVAAGVNYGSGRTIAQEPGDIFVLITDGFFEWHNPAGEQFGIERLEAALRASRDLGAAEIIARMYASVREFVQDAPQEDDLTAVVIKRVAV